MRLTVLQDKLSKALSIVGRAVAKRSTLPVLGNILLDADGKQLRLSATNLEIGINVWIDATVEEVGSITLPSQLLAEFVNGLPQAQRVEISLNSRTMTAKLKCGKFDANIKGIDGAEFPIVSTVSDDRLLIPARTLKQMVRLVSFSAATDESRPTLTGVEVAFAPERLTMAATDGYRLSVYSAAVDSGIERTLIIPAKSLAELERAIPDNVGEDIGVAITVADERNQISFGIDTELGSILIVSSLIDARFPDYRAIIPKSSTTKARFKRSDMLSSVRVAGLFARDNSNIVRLHVNGNIKIAGTSSESGDGAAEVDAAITGPEVEIAFNASYVTAALSAVSAETVTLELTQSNRPGRLTVDGLDFQHVIMPMSPQNK